MKGKLLSKIVSGLLCVSLFTSSFPATAMAYDADYHADTHTVFQHEESILAPGVEQYINHAYSADGKQMIYYVATADINREDVVVQTSYKNQFENKEFGMAKMTEQIAYANQLYSDESNPRFISPYYNVVVGVNASFYNMGTGQPSGVCYLDGIAIGESASYNSYFAILNNGKAIIDYTTSLEANKPNIKHAVAGSVMLVYQGKDVTEGVSGAYNTGREPRTCVGVTADGKVVVASLDGRQEPRSCGASMHELAQIMLEAGCEYAINLDGGGSTTYIAKPEGENDVKILNKPSDGTERSVSSGLIIASLAAPTDAFERATISVENDYITPGSSAEITATGISAAGTAAEIPEDVSWQATNGTIEDGIFTSNGTVGDAEISMIYNGKVVGTKTVHVVIPEKIEFQQSAITVPFGAEIGLKVRAMYGLNEVALELKDIEYQLDDPSIGTIRDGVFYAAESGSETKITAILTCKRDITASVPIKLGKGSEVLFDFEEGTVGTDLSKWEIRDHECTYPTYGELTIVDKETGMVHSGEQALAFHLDVAKHSVMGSEAYNAQSLTWMGDPIALKNALSIGFWIYIPKEATQTEITLTYFYYDENNVQQKMAVDVCLHDYMDEIDSSGWHYLSAPIDKELVYVMDGKELGAREGVKRNFFLKFYITNNGGQNESSYMGDNIYYIDDVTVDYSDAVEDREAPVFTDLLYAGEGMSDAVSLNGQTVKNNSNLSFMGNVREDTSKSNFSGINESTAKAYIDGTEVESSYSSNGIISVSNIELTNGVHTIKFSISDNNGNYSEISRQINVEGASETPSVRLIPKEPKADRIPTGSVYYADVVADKIETVNEIEMKLRLDTMHKWELDHMDVIPGFDANYYFASAADKAENIVTLVFTRNGEVDASGTQVLAELPVRVWSYVSNVTGNTNPAQAWKDGSITAVSVNIETQKGMVEYLDSMCHGFSNNNIHVDTEAYTYQVNMDRTEEGKSWRANHTYHVHSAEPMEDKSATCTEKGYTGRTFCKVCNSVVEWGTTIPATGHHYEITDGVLKCTSCDETFTGTWTDGRDYYDGEKPADGWKDDFYYTDGFKAKGVCEVEGSYYDFGEDGKSRGIYTGVFYDEADSVYRFAQAGKLSTGWKQIDDEWYYFVPETQAAGVGNLTISGIDFHFEENGRLTSGVWEKTSEGTRYWYGPSYYKAFLAGIFASWQVIDGKTYNFDHNGYRSEGICALMESNGRNPVIYEFSDEGVLLGQSTKTGVVITSNGDIYYAENGVSTYAGLVRDTDGSYYYFSGDGLKAVKNCTRVILKTNGLLPAGTYTFGPDGKMILKQGLVFEDNGDIYYYIDGQPVFAGLVMDSEGNYYYIDETTLKAVKDCEIEITKTNNLLPPGKYKFDKDGRLIYVKQGLIFEENGDIRYYVDGIAVYAGLVRDWRDGSYYYISGDGLTAVKDCYKYISYTNGLLPAGTYQFEKDGRLVLKQGLYFEVNGDIRYYENNIPVYAGLIQDQNGDYYYISGDGLIAVKNCKRYISFTNDLLPEGNYEFGPDGKMIKQGVMKDIDGSIRYYVNNVAIYAGLVQDWNGDYYYISGNDLTAVKDCYKFITYTNGLLPAGTYQFDKDGKLISKNGLYFETNGDICYYKNNIPTYAGLVQDNEGNYYYISGNDLKAIKNCTKYISYTNGLLPAGNYTFGADGKMILE